MEPQMKSGVCSTKCLAAKAGAVLTAVLALSVPVYGVSLVTSGGNSLFGGPAIEASDDLTTNGVVQSPDVATSVSATPATSNDSSGDVVLQDWHYTGKPNPSPGH
jgi:hypothetical protein